MIGQDFLLSTISQKVEQRTSIEYNKQSADTVRFVQSDQIYMTCQYTRKNCSISALCSEVGCVMTLRGFNCEGYVLWMNCRKERVSPNSALSRAVAYERRSFAVQHFSLFCEIIRKKSLPSKALAFERKMQQRKAFGRLDSSDSITPTCESCSRAEVSFHQTYTKRLT